ncbi:MAG: dihydrodipicolinate synthase family protein [Desulfobacteraceae bacterium]|nr:MAG: dihydrodipicolinate synthase family protein [Desulfobacteraceae bacterium]
MVKEISLKGCFPPIPTPFDDRGKVDHDRLALNLEKWQETPLSGFVVLGSNGEVVFLKEEEKIETWKTAGATIKPDRLFIAGTGCESSIETIELTEKAANVGAHAAMVVTPHYYRARMDHRSLVTHYTMIADRSPIPIILYNVPGFTGIDLSVETVNELAQHPNIIGLKESSGNLVKIGQLVQSAGDAFQVLAGSGSFLLPALAVGAVGGVMALACVAPHALAELIQSFDKGDLKRARDLQLRLIRANAAVTTKFGIPGLKAAMDLTGMYGGPVRPPLLPLEQQEKGEVKSILRKAGILA